MSVYSTGNFRIVVFVGGAKLALVSQYVGAPNTLVIVIDNPNELAKHKSYFDKHRVLYFSIGGNDTSRLLIQNADPLVQEQAELIANFGTEFGKGARAAFGYYAALKRIGFPDFIEFLEQLTNRVYIATNGRPELTEIFWFCSYVGATGGGALTVLERALTTTLAKTGLVVHSHFELLGSTTFMGASPRARQIGAASLVAITSAACFPDTADNGIARTALLSDLPPFGKDHKTRNKFLNIEAQASASPEFLREMSIRRPNDAATNVLGNIYSREMDVIGSIPEAVVIGQVARSLRNEMDRAVELIGYHPGLISEMFVEQTSEAVSRPELKAVAEIATQIEFDELAQRLKQPGHINHLTVIAQLADGNRLDLGQMGHDFRHLPHSIDDAVSQINLLYTLQEVISTEVDECRLQIEKLEQLAVQTENELQAAHKKVIRAQGKLRPSAQEAFFGLLEDFQNLSDEFAFYRDIEEVLDQAHEDTGELIELHQASLAAIRDRLTEYVPSGLGSTAPDLIFVTSLNVAFQRLLELPDLGEEECRSYLAQFVLGVTIHGMARLAGTHTTRYQQIAQLLLTKAPDLVGPPLGGKQRHDPAANYLILPNSSLQVREAIEAEIKLVDPAVVVCFTERAGFGVAAVRFRLRQFRSVADIFDGQLINDLNEAFQEVVWRLNFIHGRKDLEAIGAQIIDGRIQFPSEDKP